MKIFTDLHHAGLYRSLSLLFEERLGHELYRPIGWDWFYQGYWKIGDPYPNPVDTARQYLATDEKGWRFYINMNGVPCLKDGISFIDELGYNYQQKAITFEQFKDMNFDIIMPTYQFHNYTYEKLRDLYHPKAKMISQMGNAGQTTHLPNVLHSSHYFSPKPWQHCLRYFQEIDTKIFSTSIPNPETRNIYSTVSCAPFLDLFKQYKSLVPEANWKYFGAGSPERALRGPQCVAKKIKEANIIWQVRGGGLGHSLMEACAIGRPIITGLKDHIALNTRADQILIPGYNCINLDAGTLQQNINKIKWLLAKPQRIERWSRRVCKQFFRVIDYVRIAQEVKEFIENLI